MVARKETNKKTRFEGRIFHVASHKLFSVGEPDDMIATLLFANLVCSLLCWLKDCDNGQESKNEEILMSESRYDSLPS